MQNVNPSPLSPSPEGGNHLTPVSVRRAVPEDAPALLALVQGLAEYERLPPPDDAARRRLVRDMFSRPPRVSALLAEIGTAAVGYAFYFETYSSFLARPTLYLEDIFVRPEFRGRKAGIALFQFLVREALDRGCGRMEWVVLDWNRAAIEFYERLGAKHMKEWQLQRMDVAAMESFLAGDATPPRH
jgi:GNAT superfamily N-acetyltransferase